MIFRTLAVLTALLAVSVMVASAFGSREQPRGHSGYALWRLEAEEKQAFRAACDESVEQSGREREGCSFLKWLSLEVEEPEAGTGEEAGAVRTREADAQEAALEEPEPEEPRAEPVRLTAFRQDDGAVWLDLGAVRCKGARLEVEFSSEWMLEVRQRLDWSCVSQVRCFRYVPGQWEPRHQRWAVWVARDRVGSSELPAFWLHAEWQCGGTRNWSEVRL